jgi:hypothetical protein
VQVPASADEMPGTAKGSRNVDLAMVLCRADDVPG